MNPAILVIIMVLIAIVMVYIAIHNGLVNKKNRVDQAFSSIDVMLKKRYDLIPNLVNTTKTYMKHEADTLEKLTELRTKTTSGSLSDNETIALNNEIGQALSKVVVAVENYPELKASDNFVMLQRSLNEVEEQLSASRRAYNAAITDYNNGLEMFPSSIIARSKGYKRRELFQIENRERQNIDVQAMFNA